MTPPSKNDLKDELAALAERAGVSFADLAATAADLDGEADAHNLAAAERALERYRAGASCRDAAEVFADLKRRLEERIASTSR